MINAKYFKFLDNTHAFARLNEGNHTHIPSGFSTNRFKQMYRRIYSISVRRYATKNPRRHKTCSEEFLFPARVLVCIARDSDVETLTTTTAVYAGFLEYLLDIACAAKPETNRSE